MVGQVALRRDTDRAAVTLWFGKFLARERFRRLTLRSATGLSQRDKLHLGWQRDTVCITKLI
jgi:hypothetical protein